ncbi:MAG TPA: orotidine-5'-phosphate decarboxylase [Firmicutes bacterium]|nr:orotidine-5'-phosphate decarboxylase [Bacillota bacterium]
MANFNQLLQSRWSQGHFLCVGLDSDYQKLPTCIKTTAIADSLIHFNREIIEATAEFCCAFKPNIAFYEGYGLEGLKALIETNRFIREHYPEIPIILDAKRADIGSTNKGYVKAAFEIYFANAITVHPYLGQEALQPFLENPEIGVIVLCHTSNPGAGEFQELQSDGRELYKIVASRVSQSWNRNHNCGLVVGATYPEQLAEVRQIAGDLPLLIPGIGAQGGDLAQTVTNGLNSKGSGIIINSSRSIIYASDDRDFMQAAGAEAAKLDQAIRQLAAAKCNS